MTDLDRARLVSMRDLLAGLLAEWPVDARESAEQLLTQIDAMLGGRDAEATPAGWRPGFFHLWAVSAAWALRWFRNEGTS